MAFGISYQIDYFCGWRYLFSANYRDKVKQKWGDNLMMQSLFLIGSFVGIFLTSVAAVILVKLIWFLMTSDI